MSQPADAAGHRARLRQSFIRESGSLSEGELLELILTYAIPRVDVAPHADRLLQQFGGLAGVLRASYSELLEIPGIGEATAALLAAVGAASKAPYQAGDLEPAQPERGLPVGVAPVVAQAPLFDLGVDAERHEAGPAPAEEGETRRIGTFANDEAANALLFIPQAAQFSDVEAFRAHLRERLPYNSASTRQRRASYIVDRFYRAGRLDVPLTYFAAHCAAPEDLKPAIFYHLLRAEPLAAKIADELVWPALPVGRLGREDIREAILRFLPDLGAASQAKVLEAIFNTYNVLGVGAGDGNVLRFQAHAGTLEGLLYVLTSEFSVPGVYTFEALEAGPLRRWLLWDRDWLRRQLYNLQDFGILSKVSEIDTVRQFALPFDQMTALRRYFDNPRRGTVALREQL